MTGKNIIKDNRIGKQIAQRCFVNKILGWKFSSMGIPFSQKYRNSLEKFPLPEALVNK